MSQQNQISWTSSVGNGIFFGSIYSFFSVMFLHYVFNRQSFQMNSIEQTIFSQNFLLPFLGGIILYVLYDFKQYLNDNTRIFKTVSKDNNSTTVKPINHAFIKERLEEMPKIFGYSHTNHRTNVKRFDELISYKKDSMEAIFENPNGTIEWNNYLEEKNIIDIKRHLELDVNGYYEAVPNKSNQVKLYLKDPFGFFGFDPSVLKKGAIFEGYNKRGEPYYTDIFRTQNCGTVGTIGSGKSNSINCELISVFHNEEYYDEIHLADIKDGVELNRYQNILNGKVKTYSGLKETCELIVYLFKTMEERMVRMKDDGGNESLEKPIYVLVDEAGALNLTLQGKPSAEEKAFLEPAMEKLKLMITKSRAIRIYIKLYAQGGTVDYYPSIIANNLPMKRILKTDSWIENFFPTEKFKEMGIVPSLLPQGAFVLRDDSESFDRKGTQFAFLKAPYVSSMSVISILPDESKTMMITPLYGKMKKYEQTVTETSFTSLKNELKGLKEFFSKDQSKYIDKQLLQEYYDRNGMTTEGLSVKQEETKNYIDEYTELYNELLKNFYMNRKLFNDEVETIITTDLKVNKLRKYTQKDMEDLNESLSFVNKVIEDDKNVIDVEVELPKEEVKVEINYEEVRKELRIRFQKAIQNYPMGTEKELNLCMKIKSSIELIENEEQNNKVIEQIIKIEKSMEKPIEEEKNEIIEDEITEIIREYFTEIKFELEEKDVKTRKKYDKDYKALRNRFLKGLDRTGNEELLETLKKIHSEISSI
jgi:hypothetical protein